MDYLPVFLNVRGQRALVIGAGQVATRKIRLLLRAGASIEVCARKLSDTVAEWLSAGRVRHVSEEYQAKEDLYSRSGHHEPVVRLVVMVYDEASSYCHTIQRYVAVNDAARLHDMLLACVPENARNEDRCESHLISGMCIDRGSLGVHTELILGLGNPGEGAA